MLNGVRVLASCKRNANVVLEGVIHGSLQEASYWISAGWRKIYELDVIGGKCFTHPWVKQHRKLLRALRDIACT